MKTNIANFTLYKDTLGGFWMWINKDFYSQLCFVNSFTGNSLYQNYSSWWWILKCLQHKRLTVTSISDHCVDLIRTRYGRSMYNDHWLSHNWLSWVSHPWSFYRSSTLVAFETKSAWSLQIPLSCHSNSNSWNMFYLLTSSQLFATTMDFYCCEF